MIDENKLAELRKAALIDNEFHANAIWTDCVLFEEILDTIESLWRENAKLKAVAKAAGDLSREQGRMRDNWAEGDDKAKQSLWKNLHVAGDRLFEFLSALKETK